MTITAIYDYQPTYFWILCALLSLVVGSFLNVVIYRLPVILERLWRIECQEFLVLNSETKESVTKTFNLWVPTSHCPHCKAPISIFSNIPIASFLIQRGRCRHCKAKISWRYPFIEALTAAITLLTLHHFGINAMGMWSVVLIWSLIPLAMIDIDHQIIPDSITLPILWLGLLINTADIFVPLEQAVLGAIFGYLFLYIIFWLFKFMTKKEGMGYGDFKLLAMLGAWLGWQQIPVMIIVSSFLGTLIGITLIIFKKHDRNQPIPFGPYIALSGLLSLFWGNNIVESYSKLVIYN